MERSIIINIIIVFIVLLLYTSHGHIVELGDINSIIEFANYIISSIIRKSTRKKPVDGVQGYK